ncbi:MAG: PEP-utilizing enzyme [Ilumatobacteraceae bacterium]
MYAPGRERSKTNCILVAHEMRLPLREWGRRLVERGAFDHIEQVFMLTDDELDAAVADPAAFTEIVREREAYYLSLFEVEPPFVMVDQPPPMSDWPTRDTSTTVAAVGTTLTGISGCPGVAVGRARVVLDPADPRGLEPGEILVAPHTDPAWTPLFVTAAAVVVDVGAQITHAVIVSRELGLPCVVSAIGATRTIPDGALIEVDGALGTVKVLELPA